MSRNITYVRPLKGYICAFLGFTLSEVLIAIAILGIVAVLTLPPIVKKYNERVWERQDWAVQHKLTLATDEMKGLGLIGYYDSTESFVNVLKKYFKIAQVCKNDNLEHCWPTKTIIRADGSEVNVADLKTGKNFNPKDWTRNNLGILTADGTSIIMSYKDVCPSLDPMSSYFWDSGMKTNATTSCIAMIYDLNGKGKPNQSGKDVRLFNVSSLGKSFECINMGGVCMMLSDVSYGPLSQAECERYKGYLGVKRCPYAEDYWAGALKACSDLGGKIPSGADFDKIAKAMGFKFGVSGTTYYFTIDQLDNALNLLPPTSSSDLYLTTEPVDAGNDNESMHLPASIRGTNKYFFKPAKESTVRALRDKNAAGASAIKLRCVK